MRVLVTGALGFIGTHIVAALSAAGHEVVRAVRAGHVIVRCEQPAIICDMATDLHEEDWLPRLAGIDAVVNCAGILREHGSDHFDAVHVQAPLALFRACVRMQVRRVVQISALGDPADGEFIASKHRGDDALLALDLDAIVLRPSVVYSTAGSHGGTSLLRALAALPGFVVMPGSGAQRLQPVAGEDVGLVVVAALAHPQVGRVIFDVVGPNVLTLADYLLAWRRWLGGRSACAIHVPMILVRIGTSLAEVFGRGPLGSTMQRMLERGNVGAPNAYERLCTQLGVVPRSLAHALTAVPAREQDRWHARLYFALTLLRFALALLWIASGLLGLMSSSADIAVATQGAALPISSAVMLARFSGVVDLILGVLCLVHWRPRWVLASMLTMVIGYTLAIGILWPRYWLDPFGGLAKNLPLAAALWVLLATEERR